MKVAAEFQWWRDTPPKSDSMMLTSKSCLPVNVDTETNQWPNCQKVNRIYTSSRCSTGDTKETISLFIISTTRCERMWAGGHHSLTSHYHVHHYKWPWISLKGPQRAGNALCLQTTALTQIMTSQVGPCGQLMRNIGVTYMHVREHNNNDPTWMYNQHSTAEINSILLHSTAEP